VKQRVGGAPDDEHFQDVAQTDPSARPRGPGADYRAEERRPGPPTEGAVGPRQTPAWKAAGRTGTVEAARGAGGIRPAGDFRLADQGLQYLTGKRRTMSTESGRARFWRIGIPPDAEIGASVGCFTEG